MDVKALSAISVKVKNKLPSFPSLDFRTDDFLSDKCKRIFNSIYNSLIFGGTGV